MRTLRVRGFQILLREPPGSFSVPISWSKLAYGALLSNPPSVMFLPCGLNSFSPSLASRASASRAGSKVVALLVSRLLVVVDLLGWDVASALGLFRPNSPLVSESAAREPEVTVPTASGISSLARVSFVTLERYVSELSLFRTKWEL